MTDTQAETTYITVNGERVYGATSGGKPVTDAMIQAWADEAERGYDIDWLKKRGRPRMGDEPALVTTLRLEPSLASALDARAQRDNVSKSEVMRAALRAWLEA